MTSNNVDGRISAKGKSGFMKIMDVCVDYGVNVRDKSNYDLETIKGQIRTAGRILMPLIIRGEDKTVLAGHRRTLGGQELRNDPNCPAELRDALDKVPVIVYHGLTQQEQTSLILDHGGSKPISRYETIVAVWRLDKEFYNAAQILAWMYYVLAQFTGNTRKLAELPSTPKEKESFLKKWFHGTLDNFIIAAARMGSYVQEQFLLTHKKEDGLLKEGEVVEISMSRARITELSKAKNADGSKDGKGWTVEKGGEKFNELLAKFKDEDKNGTTKERLSRPSVKDLTDRAATYKSPAIRNALLVASGDNDAGKALATMDEQLARWTMVSETILKRIGDVKDAEVAALLRAIVADVNVPAGEVELALNPFTVDATLPTEPEPEPNATGDQPSA